MPCRLAMLLLLILPLAGAVPLQAADLRLAADVTRDHIYLGETFDLNLLVSGADNGLQAPDLSGLSGATITLLGSESRSRRSVSWGSNNRLERYVTLARLFTYRIKPDAKGVCHPGPISLRHKGQTYRLSAPDVRVTGIEQQDHVILTLEASRETVLIDDPFTVTLRVSLRMLPGTYRNTDPLLPAAPPLLECKYLSPRGLPGLNGPDFNAYLQKRVIGSPRSPGFFINSFKLSRNSSYLNPFVSGFSGLDRPQLAKFRLDRTPGSNAHEGRWIYTISLTYMPAQEGSYTFGPAIFKGRVVTDVDAGNADIKEVYAIGPAATVRVLPPPEEGRPDCYAGTLGKDLSVASRLDTQTCKVGDPLKLTLDITGTINQNALRPPLLSLQTNLTERFRIYDDAVRTEPIQGGKRFIYRVRPLVPGTYEFPGIQVGYYDKGQHAYVVRTTDPIPLQANAAAQVHEDNVIDTATNRIERTELTEQRLLTRRQDIAVSAITLDPAGGRPAAHRPLRTLLLQLLIGPGTCLLVALAVALWLRLPSVAARKRRQQAWPKARTRLRRAARRAHHHPAQARRAAVEATRQYVAERLGATRQAMAPHDIRSQLEQQALPNELVNALVDPLHLLFDAAYAPDKPGEAPDEGALEQINSLRKALGDVSKAMSKKGETA